MPHRPARSCPRDGAALVEETSDGVTLDRCATCRGLFLDASEPGAVLRRDLPAGEGRPTFPCPACGERMRALAVDGVEVDACAACGGLWLDHGESSVLRRAGPTQAPASPPAPPAPRTVRSGLSRIRRFLLGRIPFSEQEAAFRARACPRDHAPLRHREIEVLGPDVAVDDCPKCGGVFLDKNELLRITGDRRLNSYLRDEVYLDSDSTLVCPHCGGIMDEERAAGVTVDVCLTCYGLWLDRGELDALKARGNGERIDGGPEKEIEAARAKAAGRRTRRRFAWVDGALNEMVRKWL